MTDIPQSKQLMMEAFAAPAEGETAEQKAWMAVGFAMGLTGVIGDLAPYLKKNRAVLPIMKPFFQQLLMLSVMSGAEAENEVMGPDDRPLNEFLQRFRKAAN